MSYYAENMRSKGKDVHYFKHNEAQLSNIFEKLKQCTSQVHVVDPTDYLLEKRIRRFAQQHELELIWHDNPSFLNSRSDNDLLLGKQTQRFFLADFYKKQRLRLGILLEHDGQPTGGRWSFDADNRKALPKA